MLHALEATSMNDGAMSAYVLPLLIGVVAGMRAMTAPAAVSWAAYLGRLTLGGGAIGGCPATGRQRTHEDKEAKDRCKFFNH